MVLGRGWEAAGRGAGGTVFSEEGTLNLDSCGQESICEQQNFSDFPGYKEFSPLFPNCGAPTFWENVDGLDSPVKFSSY